MKTTILILLAAVLTACAGADLKSEWEDQRGYSSKDVDAIMTQYQEYNHQLVHAKVDSNAFDQSRVTEARARLKAVFCSCVKQLGDRCRKKPSGLDAEEKALWVKANAVDMAMVGQLTSFEASSTSTIDPAECQ